MAAALRLLIKKVVDISGSDGTILVMHVDALQLFCDVASCRSVSKAADLHGVTQSAVSQRLQALEKGLGVQLIDRSKRPLELTAAGEMFYRGGRRILASYDKLVDKVTGQASQFTDAQLRGQVHVAAIYSAGIDLLNRVKAAFEERYPGAEVVLNYHQPETVYDHVRQQQCELGIISYGERWAGVACLGLRDEQMVVVTRPGHPLTEGRTVHATHLSGQAFVGFDPELPIARHMRQYFRQHGVRPHVINEFDNIDTIKTFLTQQDGAAAMLPLRTIQQELDAGELAAAKLEPMLARPLSIIYLRQRSQSPLVKTFIEYLRKHQPPRPALSGTAVANANT